MPSSPSLPPEVPRTSPAHAVPCLLVSLRWTWFVNLISVVVLAAALMIGAHLGGDSASARVAAAPSVRVAASLPAGTPASAGKPVEDAGSARQMSTESPANSAPRAVAAADGNPVSALAADGIPSTALQAYESAAARELQLRPGCGLQWPLLAAIGRVESDHNRFDGAVLHSDGLATPPVIGPALDGHGTALIRDTDHGTLDGDSVYDHAVGPMQFIPSTWERFGVDNNGDGVADPFNIFDAAAAAADYLCVAGGDLATSAGQTRAVLAYNHSDSYVAEVLLLEQTYADGAGVIVPVAGDDPSLPVASPGSPPAVSLPPVNPAPPPGLPSVTASQGSSAPASSVVPTSQPPATTDCPGPSIGTPSSDSSSSQADPSDSASTSAPSSGAPSCCGGMCGQ